MWMSFFCFQTEMRQLLGVLNNLKAYDREREYDVCVTMDERKTQREGGSLRADSRCNG